MTRQMLDWFGIKEDLNLHLMAKDQSLSNLTAKVINSTLRVLKNIKPHLVIVEGDTATVMASSIAAFYLRIPIVHVEAGLRTSDIYNPFPEEMSRRIVSHLASIHFAPTKKAVLNLRKENIKSNVYLTGNTVIDALFYTIKHIGVERRLIAPLQSLKKHRIILVTIHRRENFGKAHREIAKTLVRIVKAFPDIVIILPLHKNPNVRKVLKPILKNHKRIILVEPLDYVSFVLAMKNSYLVLTDSGGVQEEAPSLGKPVLVLRTKTERPEGIKAGTAKLVGINPKKIFNEVSRLLTSKKAYSKMAKAKSPYGDGKAAKRIVKILTKIV